MTQTRRVAWGIVGLGAAAFVIPFVGPLFNFGMGPDSAFTVTSSRVLRHVLPGTVVVVGGMALLSGTSFGRRTGGLLALIGAVWLAVYPWASNVDGATQFIKRGVYHWGTGIVLVILATYALTRMASAKEQLSEQAKSEAAQEHKAVSVQTKPAST